MQKGGAAKSGDPLAEIRAAELEELDALLDAAPDRAGTAKKQSVDAKRNKLAPGNKSAFKPETNFVNPHKPEAPPIPSRDNRGVAKESAAAPPAATSAAPASPRLPEPVPQQPTGGAGSSGKPASHNTHMDDGVVRLEKLKVIYEKGLLDKDEYEARRKLLLDELLAPPK